VFSELINPIFFTEIVCGILFVIASYFLLRYPPRKINFWYGYRTASSMKNKERWDFAQRVGARYMRNTGCIFIIIGLLSSLWHPTKVNYPYQFFVAFVILFVGIFVMKYRVDLQIKKKFD